MRKYKNDDRVCYDSFVELNRFIKVKTVNAKKKKNNMSQIYSMVSIFMPILLETGFRFAMWLYTCENINTYRLQHATNRGQNPVNIFHFMPLLFILMIGL